MHLTDHQSQTTIAKVRKSVLVSSLTNNIPDGMLTAKSEAYIRELLTDKLPASCRVYLFGSRARQNHRWNSDYDIWVDGEVPRCTLAEITDELEESFVPFKVDLVCTSSLKGRFAEQVR